MPYLLFLKKQKIRNCCLLQIIGGALRVNCLTELYIKENNSFKNYFHIYHPKYVVGTECCTLGQGRTFMTRYDMFRNTGFSI